MLLCQRDKFNGLAITAGYKLKYLYSIYISHSVNITLQHFKMLKCLNWTFSIGLKMLFAIHNYLAGKNSSILK